MYKQAQHDLKYLRLIVVLTQISTWHFIIILHKKTH